MNSDITLAIESDEQRKAREAREKRIQQRLMLAPDPYPEASNERTLKVQWNGLYIMVSPHWLLCYYWARHSGIACMITSAYIAKYKVYMTPNKNGNVGGIYGQVEEHYVPDRELDYLLLFEAQKLLKAMGKTKAANPRREQVAA